MNELQQVSIEMKDKIDELRHAGGLLGGWRVDVFDDEQFLSRAHEAQLPARDLFDRRGVFAQAAGLFAERRIFRSQPRQIGGQIIILFARPERRHQPLIADERIDDDDADGKEEESGEEPASATLCALEFLGCETPCSHGV